MKNFIVFLFCGMFIYGCNPAKRLQKNNEQYQQIINDYLVNNPPRIDSMVELIPGGIDTLYYPKMVLDSVRMQAIKDSLQKAFHNTEKDCVREINEAFETGKQQALYELQRKTFTRPRPDTIIKKMYRIGYENGLLKKIEQLTAEGFEKEKTIAQKQSLIWGCLAVTLLLLVAVIYIIQKK